MTDKTKNFFDLHLYYRTHCRSFFIALIEKHKGTTRQSRPFIIYLCSFFVFGTGSFCLVAYFFSPAFFCFSFIDF